MPDRAEIVARPKALVGHAADSFTLFAEYRDAGESAILAAVAHVLGEAGLAMGHHTKAPTAPGLEFLLRRRLVRRGDDKSGAIFDVGQDPVEAVCPQRAIAAAGALLWITNRYSLSPKS